MNLEKLKPWNWFRHEQRGRNGVEQVPVKRDEAEHLPATAAGAGSLLQLHREMDRLFDNVFAAFGVPAVPGYSGLPDSGLDVMSPQVDVSGDDKQYEVVVDVPGLSADDISVEVHGDTLTISGSKEDKNESKDKHFYRVERRYGAFRRTLSLPDDARADDIRASLKDGVLRLEIPRVEGQPSDVKRIAISS